MRKKAIRTDARREYERAWRQANKDKVSEAKARYRASMYCNAAIGNFKEDLRMLGGPAKYYLEYWFSRVEGELCQSL